MITLSPSRILGSLLLIATAMTATANNNDAKTASSTSCPDFLNHEYRKLHSDEKLNLCELYNNKAMVIVNTASHCGYTKQFGGLEKLHQAYKDQGLTVIGFASDSFKQETKDEAESAGICYKNYGVTFTMLAATDVKGKNANATFKYLNAQSKAPSWNFNKYLISADGKTVQHYGSNTKPMSKTFTKDTEQAL